MHVSYCKWFHSRDDDDDRWVEQMKVFFSFSDAIKRFSSSIYSCTSLSHHHHHDSTLQYCCTIWIFVMFGTDEKNCF